MPLVSGSLAGRFFHYAGKYLILSFRETMKLWKKEANHKRDKR